MIDTLQFLLGEWSVARSLGDHFAGIDGTFCGSASIERASTDSGIDLLANYVESGEIRFGSHIGPARRVLHYASAPESALLVLFDDKRRFAELDLGGGAWSSVHHCGSDRYEITTEVKSSGVIEERWRVRGPTKSYDAVTQLTRIG